MLESLLLGWATGGGAGCISRVGVGARRWHGLWREREGEHAPVFSSPFWGFRAMERKGVGQGWR